MSSAAKTAAVLTLLAGLLFASRWQTRHEPLHGDIAYYAIMAHEMRQGRALYSELVDHKPPFLFVLFQAAERVAGYGPQSVFVLNITFSLLMLFLLFALGRKGASSAIPGILAAGFWTVVSGDLALEGNQPNAELLANGFICAALLCLCRQPTSSRTTQHTAVAGALLGLATLIWQPVLMIALGLAAGWFLAGWGTMDRNARLRLGVIFGFSMSLPWLVTISWFIWTHRLSDFLEWLFYFQLYYAKQTGFWTRIMESLNPRIVPTELGFGALRHFGLWLMVPGMGILLAFWRRQRDWLILAGWAVGIHLALLAAGKYFSHYYQLWIPLLAVSWGWTWRDAALEKPLLRRTITCVIALAGIATGVRQLGDYRWSGDQWSMRKYGHEFIVTRAVGLDLARQDPRALLIANETFYNWGTQTGLYFYSGRAVPVGTFYAYFLLFGPRAREQTQQVLQQLQNNPPELWIGLDPTLAMTPFYDQHPVARWGQARYRAFEWPGHSGSFRYRALRGGALEKRMEQGLTSARFTEP